MAGWDPSVVSSVPLDLNVPDADAAADEKKALTGAAAQAKFRSFLMSHRGVQGTAETYPYRSQLKANYTQGEHHFTLNVDDLQAFSRELAEAFKNRPADYLPLIEEAAKEVIASVTLPKPNVADMQPLQCIVTNFPAATPIRLLASSDVERVTPSHHRLHRHFCSTAHEPN